MTSAMGPTPPGSSVGFQGDNAGQSSSRCMRCTRPNALLDRQSQRKMKALTIHSESILCV